MATYYVDQTNGVDAAAGTTTGTAWKTLSKVNSASYASGDTVLLKRGEIWRENLIAKSNVTYDAYGTGNKPSIRGSNTLNSTANWTQEGVYWYASGITLNPYVFAHDEVLGRRRVVAKTDMTQDWDYWYDDPNDRLYVRLGSNPASVSSLLEYAVRFRMLGYQGLSNTTWRNLDVRHDRGRGATEGNDVAWGTWGGTNERFEDCDFIQMGGNICQWHNGSTNGAWLRCKAINWGISGHQCYPVQVIGGSTAGPSSGPVDVEDCYFEISYTLLPAEWALPERETVATMTDYHGWIRRWNRNTCNGLSGRWSRDGVVIWQPGPNATFVEVKDNTFYSMGGMAIALQEVQQYGATPTITVSGNVCYDSNTETDRVDSEAIRVRGATNLSDITLSRNLIARTVDSNTQAPRSGIRVTSATGIKLFHNTVVGCEDGIRMDGTAPTVTARNNISSGNRVSAVNRTAGTLTESHNVFHGTVTGFTRAGTTSSADPLFVNAATNNFTLQAGSPAVDTGMVIAGINDGFVGAAPDAGAYERSGSVVYRPTSTVAAGGWTTSSASLHAALSDQSNATLITGTGT